MRIQSPSFTAIQKEPLRLPLEARLSLFDIGNTPLLVQECSSFFPPSLFFFPQQTHVHDIHTSTSSQNVSSD